MREDDGMDGVLVFILLLLQSVWEGTGLFFLQPPNILNAEICLKALFNCSFSIWGGGRRGRRRRGDYVQFCAFLVHFSGLRVRGMDG